MWRTSGVLYADECYCECSVMSNKRCLDKLEVFAVNEQKLSIVCGVNIEFRMALASVR